MPIYSVLLFGSWLLFETPDTTTKAETKTVIGYSFQDVPTKKDWITKEIKTKWFLTLKRSYPANAKSYITEVISYRSEQNNVPYNGTWQIEKTYRDGFDYATEIENKRIYFNLK